MDKYKQNVDVQWWNGISKRDIENWIKNFGASKKIAELILDNVIFYNSQQMKAYTCFLINNLKEQVYIQEMKTNGYVFLDDAILEKEWEKYMSQTKFVPAALPNDLASSAHKISGHWRSVVGRGSEIFSSITNIDDAYEKGIRRFVLVDDFSGTGEQMLDVLRYKISFQGEQIELGRLPEKHNDVEIMIAVYVIHEKAKKNLNDEFSEIKIIYVDLIDDALNYLNENSSIYEKYDSEKRQEIVSQIQTINEGIMKNNEELQKLSSYVLNIPIVFEHGCPNNTLLLLFAHSDNWQQLFKRGKEI